MIASVHFDKTTYAPPPQRFEAGTPDIAGVIGLGVALDWMAEIGVERIAAWEHELLTYATAQLEAIPGLRLIGTAPVKASVVSFVLDCAHPHDIATIFDQQGVRHPRRSPLCPARDGTIRSFLNCSCFACGLQHAE